MSIFCKTNLHIGQTGRFGHLWKQSCCSLIFCSSKNNNNNKPGPCPRVSGSTMPTEPGSAGSGAEVQYRATGQGLTEVRLRMSRSTQSFTAAPVTGSRDCVRPRCELGSTTFPVSTQAAILPTLGSKIGAAWVWLWKSGLHFSTRSKQEANLGWS